MEVPWGGRKGRPWGTKRREELWFVVTDLCGGSAAEARGSFAALGAQRGHHWLREDDGL